MCVTSIIPTNGPVVFVSLNADRSEHFFAKSATSDNESYLLQIFVRRRQTYLAPKVFTNINKTRKTFLVQLEAS